MANKTLGLPDSPRKLVYRKLVSILRGNAKLKHAVRTWKVFDASSGADDAAIAEGELPAVRLLPFGQGATPETPTTQNSPLGIRVEVYTDGYNLDDLLDLWGAIEAAIFTGDGAENARTAIKSVWPNTQAIRLSQPGITPNPPDLPNGVLCGVGTLIVEMTVPH